MNKAELITALAQHMDADQPTAAAAVDGVLGIIMRAVRDGQSVSLSGFGVFEARRRPARAGRDPRTGEAITLAAKTVPAFRPGLRFRQAIADAVTGSAGQERPFGPVAGVRVIIDPTLTGGDRTRSPGKAEAAGKPGKKARGAKRGGPPGRATDGKSAVKKGGKKGKK